MESDSSLEHIRRIQALIGRIEELADRINRYQQGSNVQLNALREECDAVLAEAKQDYHALIVSAEMRGQDVTPDIALEDRRLKNTWLALYRHHGGATAEEISGELKRHRTTVSTYLNTLVLMGYAKKERVGHEVHYTAILNKD